MYQGLKTVIGSVPVIKDGKISARVRIDITPGGDVDPKGWPDGLADTYLAAGNIKKKEKTESKDDKKQK